MTRICLTMALTTRRARFTRAPAVSWRIAFTARSAPGGGGRVFTPVCRALRAFKETLASTTAFSKLFSTSGQDRPHRDSALDLQVDMRPGRRVQIRTGSATGAHASN
jgi:hypothetical protein